MNKLSGALVLKDTFDINELIFLINLFGVSLVELHDYYILYKYYNYYINSVFQATNKKEP